MKYVNWEHLISIREPLTIKYRLGAVDYFWKHSPPGPEFQWNHNWYFSYIGKYHYLGITYHALFWSQTHIWSIRKSGWLYFRNKLRVCLCLPSSTVETLIQAPFSSPGKTQKLPNSSTSIFFCISVKYSHNSQWFSIL